ncbi:DUF1289 domain-containing protein [Pseudoalteromonas lipolytica]|uniref:DUF1289 domain-containing protein n=1 Tax=Pseudoalteromonas lipolytica TaxID=570156 RepID=UPI0009EABFDF|nr:DUF1289 domain-containing protein [Pseudoalteromonas lipolytica]
MQQIEIFEIPSPCKGICQVNNRGYCKGCYRSRDERFYWNKFTNAEKRKVISLCQQRYKRYLQKKQQAENQQSTPILKIAQCHFHQISLVL